MGTFSPEDKERLGTVLVQCLDPETTGDLEGFGRHVLNNGKIWDLLADLFPEAAPSQLRAAMMEVWNQWQKAR